MKFPARHVAAPVCALVLVTAAACGGGNMANATTKASSSPSASPTPTPAGKLDAAVSMPNGFPSDFPVYTGARLTAAKQVLANGQTTWGVVWETLDGVDQEASSSADVQLEALVALLTDALRPSSGHGDAPGS